MDTGCYTVVIHETQLAYNLYVQINKFVCLFVTQQEFISLMGLLALPVTKFYGFLCFSRYGIEFPRNEFVSCISK